MLSCSIPHLGTNNLELVFSNVYITAGSDVIVVFAGTTEESDDYSEDSETEDDQDHAGDSIRENIKKMNK